MTEPSSLLRPPGGTSRRRVEGIQERSGGSEIPETFKDDEGDGDGEDGPRRLREVLGGPWRLPEAQ